jgi:arylformamidase
VDVSTARDEDGAIPRSALGDFAGERRLLLRTRRTAAESARPLSAEATAELARSDLLLLGIDGLSLDWPEDAELENHRRLADAGVAVLVGLELGAAPIGKIELVALPLPIAGLEASPVRAVVRPWPEEPVSRP